MPHIPSIQSMALAKGQLPQDMQEELCSMYERLPLIQDYIRNSGHIRPLNVKKGLNSPQSLNGDAILLNIFLHNHDQCSHFVFIRVVNPNRIAPLSLFGADCD